MHSRILGPCKISSSPVVSTVKIVLAGHENLSQQVMILLPPDLQETAGTARSGEETQDQETTVAVSGEEKQAHLLDGIAFVNNARSRFGNSNHLSVYRSFLKTMCKYREKTKSVAEVYDRMFDLFHGHADLIQEFEGFLNDNVEKVLKEIKRSQTFAMEDRMQEIDVLLSNMTSAVERVEGTLKGREECVDEGITPLQLKCSERLYAEHSPELMEKLRANPEVVLQGFYLG